MASTSSGMPIEQAAAELGVPADALRLYVAPTNPTSSEVETISEAQVGKLKEELRSRAGALRLDDLAKTALTIEWLAQAAVAATQATHGIDGVVEELEKKLAESQQKDVADRLDPLHARIEVLEGASKETATGAVQMVGSLQGMLESQGRELDGVRSEVSSLRSDVATLRSEIASIRVALHALESRHFGLVSALKGALGDDANTSGKAEARAQVPQPAPTATPVSEEAKVVRSNSDSFGLINTEPHVESVAQDTPGAAPEYHNEPVKVPAKFRVKREIEYNFLLERMGFKRLDAYEPEEMAPDIPVPTDDQIKEFLGQYELGCDPEEIEMVSVLRGEFQMVQYQRIDKASGIRSWISRGRV